MKPEYTVRNQHIFFASNIFLRIAIPVLLFFIFFSVKAQSDKLDSILPVRGICLGVPRPAGVDSFVHFIENELPSRKVNLLVLLVEYHYEFSSHPELIDSFALSKSDVRKIVKACHKNSIRVIPQIDLLGHQSWANRLNKLLQVYPQFDETPWIKMPEKYEWPNQDNLYCKSYCPLHPDLHPVIFSIIDELCEAFESNAFHAGMDEVFYLGEDKCPRCGGRDKSELFAGEVRTIQEHLAQKGRELWIWGDRLIDGKTTGLGIWEASYNNTYRAIDMIPQSVVICDWHYDRPDKTAVYFALKGFRVISCPWRSAPNAITQVNDMIAFRQQSTAEMQARFMGVLQTTWSRTDIFLRGFYDQSAKPSNENTSWNCFRLMFDAILKL
jgi:glycosyl hydrolase family 20